MINLQNQHSIWRVYAQHIQQKLAQGKAGEAVLAVHLGLEDAIKFREMDPYFVDSVYSVINLYCSEKNYQKASELLDRFVQVKAKLAERVTSRCHSSD